MPRAARALARVAPAVCLVAALLGPSSAAAAMPSPAVVPASRVVVTAARPSLPALSRVRVTTALGDSVPSGSVCGCTPFPVRVGGLIQSLTGHRQVVHDDAVGGLTSSGVLTQLWRSTSVRAHLAASDVVVVMVGANDVGYSWGCRTTVSCYAGAVRRAGVQLDRTLDQVAALRAGRPTAVVVVGYWNVWKDGAVARRLGPAYVAASVALTRQVNAVLASVARADHALYVDTWGPFRGTTGRDDTSLLAWDGDHPNGLGHGRIASAVRAALVTRLPA